MGIVGEMSEYNDFMRAAMIHGWDREGSLADLGLDASRSVASGMPLRPLPDDTAMMCDDSLPTWETCRNNTCPQRRRDMKQSFVQMETDVRCNKRALDSGCGTSLWMQPHSYKKHQKL